MVCSGGIIKNFRVVLLLLLAGFMLRPVFSQAQEAKRTRFLFLFDASGSMWGDMGARKKIYIAKEILISLVDSLEHIPNVDLGLRAYGHTSPKEKQDCKDTRLEVGFYRDNGEDIKRKIKDITPKGTTPIAYSLTQAAADFPLSPGNNIIILITDGIEECNGDPCAVSKSLQDRNVVLKPFVIGLGLSEEYSTKFNCVGRFFSATTEKHFKEILSTVVTQALNNTSMQVNLNDTYGKPTETDVNMTFMNGKSGAVLHNFYHTMNHVGKPDTFLIDPTLTYNLLVHTTPPVYKAGITLKSAVHNTIEVDAPQGELKLTVNPIDYLTLKCLVRQNGKEEIIYVQDFNTSHRYLVGQYDLEVLTLPRLKFKDVNIRQSQTATIDIPQPGKVELSYQKDVIASIYVLRNGRQEWIQDLMGYGTTRKELYYLQPGSYKIVYRNKNSKVTTETREQDFKILSGGFVSITLD